MTEVLVVGNLDGPDAVLVIGEITEHFTFGEHVATGPKGAPGTPGEDGTDGIDGQDGTNGREVELQVSATHVQWRYVGDPDWTNLIALADLEGEDGTNGTDGDDGANPEFQVNATHVQWRLVGDVTWNDLVALADITGPAGAGNLDSVTAGDATITIGGTATDPTVAVTPGTFASAAQGALADSAVQPGDLGTAAAEDVGAFDPAGSAAAAEAAANLYTDGEIAGIDLSGKLDVNTVAALATDEVLDVRVTGDGDPRFSVRADGVLQINRGTTPSVWEDLQAGVADPATTEDTAWWTAGIAPFGAFGGTADRFLMASFHVSSWTKAYYRHDNDGLYLGTSYDVLADDWSRDGTGDFTGIRLTVSNASVDVYIEDKHLYAFTDDGLLFHDTPPAGSGNPATRRITERGDSLLLPVAKTASFTFDLTNAGKVIEANHATVAIVATIPPNSTVAYPIGTVLEVYRKGAAAVSVVEGSGVTIENIVGTTVAIDDQYGTLAFRKSATDTWVVTGSPYTVS